MITKRLRGTLAAALLAVAGSAWSQPEILSVFEAQGYSVVQTLGSEGAIEIFQLKGPEGFPEVVGVSPDGQYLIKGGLFDTSGENRLSKYGQRLDSAALWAPFIQHDAVETGTPDRPTIISFFDPECDACLQLAREAEQRESDFAFRWIMTPTGEGYGAKVARAILNSEDRAGAFKRFVNTRSADLESADPGSRTLAGETFQAAQALARATGGAELPLTLYRGDTRRILLIEGLPTAEQWLMLEGTAR